MTHQAPPPWTDAVLEGRPPAPVVLVLGGFLTSPPLYRPLVRRLLERGTADVIVGSVWLPDWLLAARRGLGPILTRSSRALLEASSRAAALSMGAPVLVIGHSAGGVSARLLTSPVPFAGRPLNGSARIGAIVTLGTPHLVSDDGALGRRAGVEGATFANRVVPGAYWAPRVGYLAVASRLVAGRRDGDPAARLAWRRYQDLVAAPGAVEMAGDGLIPITSALLPGSPSVVLEEAGHGVWPGATWYGSSAVIDEWWPRAHSTWLDALRARAPLLLDRAGGAGGAAAMGPPSGPLGGHGPDGGGR